MLAHAQLKLLGACRRLTELSVDSLDLCALRQEVDAARAEGAAAFAVPRSAGSLRLAPGAGDPDAAAAAAAARGAAVSAGWPPLERAHLHSTSSYLNLQTLLAFAPALSHLTLNHYVRWDEGAVRRGRRVFGTGWVGRAAARACRCPRLPPRGGRLQARHLPPRQPPTSSRRTARA